QATNEAEQRSAKACKVPLFMTVSTMGKLRTLGGCGAFVNNREALGVPEPQPRRDQGAAPARQDHRGGSALARPGSALLQRRHVPAGLRLPDRPGAAGWWRDSR